MCLSAFTSRPQGANQYTAVCRVVSLISVSKCWNSGPTVFSFDLDFWVPGSAQLRPRTTIICLAAGILLETQIHSLAPPLGLLVASS